MELTKSLAGKRVFLSYSYKDKQKVDQLTNQLLDSGVTLLADKDLKPGEQWHDAIQYRLQSSDYIIIFFSENSLKSDWLRFEYEQAFLNYAKDRHINILPVKLDNTPLPDNLKEFQLVDFDTIVNTNYDRLLSKMVNLEAINFDILSSSKFEAMILELLNRMNFQRVEWQQTISNRGFDFMAEYYARDPFGLMEKQTWIIEFKLYKNARFDLQSVRSIIESYKYIQRKDAKLALITNSQFTSVVKDYLDQVRNTDFIDIRLIDGFQLKEIISAHPDMVQRYFTDESGK